MSIIYVIIRHIFVAYELPHQFCLVRPPGHPSGVDGDEFGPGDAAGGEETHPRRVGNSRGAPSTTGLLPCAGQGGEKRWLRTRMES